MTVQELIDKLQTMPRDAVVIYEKYSEYADMDESEVRLTKAEDKEIVFRKESGHIRYNARHWSAEEQPTFVTAVKFPGN